MGHKRRVVFETTVWTHIEQVARGDEAEAQAFVDRYRPPLLRFAECRGFSAQDSEDLVQEVFLRLFAKDLLVAADRSRGRFRSYLLAIAQNVMREEWRRRSTLVRGGASPPVPLSAVPEIPAVEPDPEFDTIWSEHLLQRALDRLLVENPRQHRVLSLRFRRDLSYRQIASEMSRTLPQVKVDLHRARQRLVRIIKVDITRYASSEKEYEEEMASFLTLIGERPSPSD